MKFHLMLLALVLLLSFVFMSMCIDWPYRDGFTECTNSCTLDYMNSERDTCHIDLYYKCIHLCLCKFAPV